MSFGMIVRADFGRGLANQTYSFWKHLQPDVTVLVDISPLDARGKWPQDLDAYPGAIRTTWRGYTASFDNPDAYQALMDCDTFYTAETFYDERLDGHGILHVNPEFYRGETAHQFWYPTVWEQDHLPPGFDIPTPVDDDCIALDLPGTNRLLHVGGHSAAADRNGSRIVHGIMGRINHSWRVASQDGMKLNPRLLRNVEPVGYVEDRWTLYEDCGILVYPRRYGGQSLQVNEAMARGLAVVMTDCEPNITTWPVVPVTSRPTARVKTAGGMKQMYQVNPQALIDVLQALVADSDMLQRWQARSLAWARDNAWSVWKPRIEELIGR